MFDIVVAPVADACADFTVLYCLINHGDHQFAAWYDPQHRITVGHRRLPQGEWLTFQQDSFWLPEREHDAHITDFDSHNYLTLAVDCAGFLHLAGNMHVDPLIYFRSERPLDITTLVNVRHMTGERENRVTYPVSFKDNQGRLLFRYRDGCSGNGDDLYKIFDSDTQRWTRLLETPLLNGEGERNGYACQPLCGPDGYWHMVWMWRESPACETNNNLSYARSRDLTHWEKSDGTPPSLPISRTQGEIVDDADVCGGLINMVQEVGFDNQGKPVLIYHRYDDQGHSQAFLARPDEQGRWQKVQISQWDFRWDFSGGGSIPPDVTLSAPCRIGNRLLQVEWTTTLAGNGVWTIDETTLNVVTTHQLTQKVPDDLRQPRQHLSPLAEVQLIAAQNSDYRPQSRYWLRWEALPIFRDVPHDTHVGATRLEVIDCGARS
ncbi:MULTISPECIES: BNR repeat-containing protein [Symbiopectobacterium]|uniref:BNR repeat-containing protein n=1 Tax=Symbiopectobacterium TaxID=801 RepID=UPI001A239BA3|nr:MULTISPECIES: BNR repeat-containing protein [Symbiopectobacterium]MBG6248000.1 hypothetical protein [Candidatus Symbiopectobacterium sp. PLON1]MBT9428598.1 BNR repeat-containing protein [Candidatus Symbiopectobacterium endolongispinus]